MKSKHEWEYGIALASLESWSQEWLGDEAQGAFLVGPGELMTAASERVAAVAVSLGWWQDVDSVWHKPVVPGRD